jgi:hypothetical protein
MTDHTTGQPDDGFQAGGPGLLPLLFVAFAAMLGVVVELWIVTLSNAVWALVVAVATALAGALAVTAMINRQLDDVDGSYPSGSYDEGCDDKGGR